MTARLFLLPLALALSALLLGFVWFLHLAFRPVPPPGHADAILVLTGGSNRIETGLHLLADGNAPRLLVSGVLPGTDPQRLARAAGLDPAPLLAHLTLGQGAISTRGNAHEAAAWLAGQPVRRLLVVTAYYHMPRALAELSRALPGITLLPVPVRPARLPENTWRRQAVLLAGEYGKYLAVRLGLPTPGPDRRPGEGLR